MLAPTAAEIRRYDDFFSKVDMEGCEHLSEEQATVFFSRSRLPLSQLSRVWELSDLDGDGRLSKNEFRIAMHLVSNMVKGFPLGDELPECLLELAGAAGLGAVAGASAAAAAAADGDGEGDDDPYWARTSEQDRKYTVFFEQLDSKGRGVISERLGTLFFSRSRLSMTTLSRIWVLCDMDRDGALNMVEFQIAMYLVDGCLKGHKIPQRVPLALLPPGFERPDPQTLRGATEGLSKHDLLLAMGDLRSGDPRSADLLRQVMASLNLLEGPVKLRADVGLFKTCTAYLVQEEDAQRRVLTLQVLGMAGELDPSLHESLVVAGIIPVLTKTIVDRQDTERLFAIYLLLWLAVRGDIPSYELSAIRAEVYDTLLFLIEEAEDHVCQVVLKLLVYLNKQQDAGRNLFMEQLPGLKNAHFLSPHIIAMLNWKLETDDTFAAIQMIQDMLEREPTADLFYINDLRVLVDVVTRELRDLDPSDELLTRMLYLLRSFVTAAVQVYPQDEGGAPWRVGPLKDALAGVTAAPNVPDEVVRLVVGVEGALEGLLSA